MILWIARKTFDSNTFSMGVTHRALITHHEFSRNFWEMLTSALFFVIKFCYFVLNEVCSCATHLAFSMQSKPWERGRGEGKEKERERDLNTFWRYFHHHRQKFRSLSFKTWGLTGASKLQINVQLHKFLSPSKKPKTYLDLLNRILLLICITLTILILAKVCILVIFFPELFH